MRPSVGGYPTPVTSWDGYRPGPAPEFLRVSIAIGQSSTNSSRAGRGSDRSSVTRPSVGTRCPPPPRGFEREPKLDRPPRPAASDRNRHDISPRGACNPLTRCSLPDLGGPDRPTFVGEGGWTGFRAGAGPPGWAPTGPNLGGRTPNRPRPCDTGDRSCSQKFPAPVPCAGKLRNVGFLLAERQRTSHSRVKATSFLLRIHASAAFRFRRVEVDPGDPPQQSVFRNRECAASGDGSKVG